MTAIKIPQAAFVMAFFNHASTLTTTPLKSRRGLRKGISLDGAGELFGEKHEGAD